MCKQYLLMMCMLWNLLVIRVGACGDTTPATAPSNSWAIVPTTAPTTAPAPSTDKLLQRSINGGKLVLNCKEESVWASGLRDFPDRFIRWRNYCLEFTPRSSAATKPSPIVLIDSGGIPISDLAIWCDPQWLDIVYDGKTAGAVFMQDGCCKAYISRRVAGGNWEILLDADNSSHHDGAVCEKVKSAKMELGDGGQVRVKVELNDGTTATFRFANDDPATNWICETDPKIPPMPKRK